MTLLIPTDTVPVKVDSDGVARIAGTRVTLDTVVAAFNEGATAEEIAQQYPSLDLADVYSVIAYYLRRRADVDEYLRVRHTAAEATRADNEGHADPRGVRDRLLRRSRQ